MTVLQILQSLADQRVHARRSCPPPPEYVFILTNWWNGLLTFILHSRVTVHFVIFLLLGQLLKYDNNNSKSGGLHTTSSFAFFTRNGQYKDVVGLFSSNSTQWASSSFYPRCVFCPLHSFSHRRRAGVTGRSLQRSST